jgi:DNA-binding transcriptional MerR regulator
MDFSLKEIKEMMDWPDYDVLKMMTRHRTALEKRVSRLNNLIDTLDKTILHLKGEEDLMTYELFRGFDDATQEAYAEEAAQRWDAEQVRASNRRWQDYSEETKSHIVEEATTIHQDLLDHMNEGHDSKAIQTVVGRWYNHLRYYYEPSLAIFRGLGQGYEEDPDFVKFYEKLHPDMPSFFRKAIDYYCDVQEILRI